MRPALHRREAIKWMLAGAAAVTLLKRDGFAAAHTTDASPPPAGGYGTDPNLLKAYVPGEIWPLTFDDQQRRTAAALCDVIIPEDASSPSASALHVPEFIDEWISAPYVDQKRDRPVVLRGLAWMDEEAQRRFSSDFADLVHGQQIKICDDICYVPEAKPEFKAAAQFFKLYRDLTSGGFYTTPQGMKDIGYVGNVPQSVFAGPPPEVLQRLNLD